MTAPISLLAMSILEEIAELRFVDAGRHPQLPLAVRKLAPEVVALPASKRPAHSRLREVWGPAKLAARVRKAAVGVVAGAPGEHGAHLRLAQLRSHQVVELGIW